MTLLQPRTLNLSHEDGLVADIFDRMRANAAAETMADIQSVCAFYGLRCTPPSGGGSHYKISHPLQSDILTIPRARRIKPVYIRKLRATDRERWRSWCPIVTAVLIEPLEPADGGGFLATVPDLPGCMSDVQTREEAAFNVGDAIEAWLEEARALGRAIPAPSRHLATTPA